MKASNGGLKVAITDAFLGMFEIWATIPGGTYIVYDKRKKIPVGNSKYDVSVIVHRWKLQDRWLCEHCQSGECLHIDLVIAKEEK